MGVKETLAKLFANARETHDEWGQPIQKESIEERLLRKHLEREHKKKVRAALKYYDDKHYKEMTSLQMPYHKKLQALEKARKGKRTRR